ncbi:membrane protein insertion efficiency factor YidD [Desulfohalovibrio reitneri]|uniref:membrane protein insertion efficiency factor YidD n=1 Tax=Desulfohalovibrio reitneri TaxID=1307759 RepID=UPI0009DF693D|nr:membrane protein insertion efficiency factor YidD [Desulfohalovibrio reitneri]
MRSLPYLLVRFYQLAVSPLTPPGCRFQPTCSEYARQALEVHGSRRGGMLALGRLLRCHPFRRGGYDPVPPPSPGDDGRRRQEKRVFRG